MSCNIANEYISYSKKSIKTYLKMIMEHYFDSDIYDDLINAYINVRYYNMYESVDKKFEVNIVHYLKKSIEHIKDDSKYKAKAKYMFQLFKYILYFDNVRECDSVRKIISEIQKFRIENLNLVNENFETEFYTKLKNDLVAKKEFLNSFNDKNFSVNYIKINSDQIFDCKLEHKLKFSKIYSQYAIEKVFNSKDIKEQRLFVLYPLVTVKILSDILKGNFKKRYLADYVLTLEEKEKKKKRILNIIDNDIVKEKIILKINYSEYIKYKDNIYQMMRDGFKFAVVIDQDKKDRLDVLFRIFDFVITNDVNLYEPLKNDFPILYIPK